VAARSRCYTHLFNEPPEMHQFHVIQQALDRMCVELARAERLGDAAKDLICGKAREALGIVTGVEAVQVDGPPVNRGRTTDWVISKIEPARPERCS
jgi:hypothetical protein